MDRQHGKMILQDLGYSVETARSGEEAWEKALRRLTSTWW